MRREPAIGEEVAVPTGVRRDVRGRLVADVVHARYAGGYAWERPGGRLVYEHTRGAPTVEELNGLIDRDDVVVVSTDYHRREWREKIGPITWVNEQYWVFVLECRDFRS